MMKTAKELFKDLGFDYDYFGAESGYRDMFSDRENGIRVIFYLEDKLYHIDLDWGKGNILNVVTVDLHRAITKRMEELGWLDE